MSGNKKQKQNKNISQDIKNSGDLSKKRSGSKIFVTIIFSLIIFIGLLVGLSLIYAKAYENQFFPGVKIAGYEVGGKTQQEAKLKLENKLVNIGQAQVTIKNNGESRQVKIADLGVSVDLDKTIKQAFSYGRDSNYINNSIEQMQSLYYGKDFNYILNVVEGKIEEKIKEIAPDQHKEPKNATVLVKDGNISIEKEEFGQKADIERLKLEIAKDLSTKENNIIIWLSINPEINQKQVETVLPQIEQIISDEIVFIDTDKHKTYNASPEEIASWLVLKPEVGLAISIEIADDAIKNFIQEDLAKKINKKMIDKKINKRTKAVIANGQDGRKLDEDKTLTSTKNILTSRLDGQSISNEIKLIVSVEKAGEIEVEPKELGLSGGTPGLAEGKYIEVNLSTQTMYLFDGETPHGSFRVSTGKWSMPTPVGTRYVSDKNARAWSARYGLYMPYWMGIGGGYGIHELPEWPGGAKEGESHLGTPVSHGCIRLGVGAAATVYNFAPVGTPVFIHK